MSVNNRIFLVVLGLVLSAWLLPAEPVSAAENPPVDVVLSADAVMKIKNDQGWVVVDARATDAFNGWPLRGLSRGGHIPGARHLAWRDVLDAGASLRSPEELRVLFGPADTPVVTYCTGGVRSGFVYTVLRSLGRDRVANYAGSWWEYAASPHPIAR